MVFVPVDEAIARIAAGELVIVVDDESRENEGDLTMAARFVTPQAVNFMIREARGLLCMPSEPSRLDHLWIGPMVADPTCPSETAFTVTIDHRSCTTGISAQERAHTIRQVINPLSRPKDFLRPGHVFPLRAREGGVLERPGHTEASVDLCRLAGLEGVAAICEVLTEDGEPARVPYLEKFAKRHGLAIASIEDLVEHRRLAVGA